MTIENRGESQIARKRAKPDAPADGSDSEAEVVDVGALQRKIRKLRKENAALKKQLRGRPAGADITNTAGPSPESIQAAAASFKKSLVSMIRAWFP